MRRLPRPVPEPPDPEKWEKERETFANELITLMEDPASVVFFGDEVAGFITRHGAELNEKVYQSIRALLKTPEVLKSVCNPYSE